MEDSTYPSHDPEPPSSVTQIVTLEDEGGSAEREVLAPVITASTSGAGADLSSCFAVSAPIAVANGKCSPQCRAFKRLWYPSVSQAEWNDWRWQLANRITSLKQLDRLFTLSAAEYEALSSTKGKLPVAITPYYASLVDPQNALQPIRRCILPVAHELTQTRGESADPLEESSHCPTPGIVHRYPDRVLFLATSFCSSYCRYCTRSRLVGDAHGQEHGKSQWEKAIAYIESRPEIRDVLLSGGDPLTLPDEQIDWLLGRLRRIPHVEILRIGTKAPAVLPQRITPSLVRTLRKYHPLWISIHAAHPDELTVEMSQACNRLADAGIPLGSQTVLLAGINDSVPVMRALMHGLMMMRVRPYYLYQCDPIIGSSHFRTPVEKGLEIIQGLRGHTSGYAVPTFVIDAPGGGGKIPLMPQYVLGREDGDVVLRNYCGDAYRYPDSPAETAEPCAGEMKLRAP